MNLRKLLSPFASGLIAFGAFAGAAAIASSAPTGCVIAILVSLVSGHRNRSGISQFLGGAVCGMIGWGAFGVLIGGQSAVSSAIILVPLVAVIAGILTIAFAVGCFIPVVRWKR